MKEQTLYYSAWKYNRSRILTQLEKMVFNNGGSIVSNWEKELTTYHIIPSYANHIEPEKAIDTNYLSYINFTLDGFIYYVQLDDNPFFDHYFQKIPVKSDLKVEFKYYLEYFKKDFMFDCLYKFDCTQDEIKEIANLIFNQLMNFKNYKIATTRRRRYISSYGSGTNKHHYVYDNIPDKEPTYNKQYYIIKES